MKRMIFMPLVASVLLAAAVGACSGDDAGPRRAGVAQVDAVIGVVESEDRESLEALLQFTSLPCTDDAAVTDRPRCQGEAAGTNVEVFQASECEARWLRREDTGALVEQVMALEPVVYAAFESPEGFYLAGRYTVVFEGDETRVEEEDLKRYVAVGVESESGRVTGMALGCGIEEPVHFLLPHLNERFDGWLIEPEG